MPLRSTCPSSPLKPLASVIAARQKTTFGERSLLSRLLISLFSSLFTGLAVPAAAAAPAESLWTSTVPIDGNRHLLMVVDPTRQVLAVYHVDATTGAVTLRSTRALAYDLQIEDFNAVDPKPAALKKMLQLGNPLPSTPITIVPTPPPAGPSSP
jgi:hypothetical protein